MVQKGAKNILIVSRSAENHPNAPSLNETCKEGGCRAFVRNCDVADEKSFLELLKSCRSIMPPIKGVLTTAMVLENTVLERMMHDQWQHAFLAKVASTMNLHKHLSDLVFFVMMSSTAGVSLRFAAILLDTNACLGDLWQPFPGQLQRRKCISRRAGAIPYRARSASRFNRPRDRRKRRICCGSFRRKE